MKKAGTQTLLLGVSLLTPLFASAHAFGQQYTLSLPLSFFILGGVSAFIASNCVILLFSEPQASPVVRAPRFISYGKPILTRWVLQTIGLFLLLTEVAFCFFGSADFTQNPAVVLFWMILLLGFTYICVFVGGVWRMINPFRTIAQFFSREPLYEYPKWLGYWPAIVLFFLLLYVELYSNGSGVQPSLLGVYLLLYTVIAVIGSQFFGTRTWFEYADFFSVFFRTVSMGAPVQLTEQGIEFSPPGQRLVQGGPTQMTALLFIIFMLSSTVLDGIKETTFWQAVLQLLYAYGLPAYSNLFGVSMLVVTLLIFFALYAGAIWSMRMIIGKVQTLRYLMLRFAYSLIPIAIAYHFAHYFTLLLGEGQRIVYQLSDPFTLGWNLFGTADYQINLVPLGADVIWYIQIISIVLGHIIAAFIAHRVAVLEFKTRRDIILSQLPMLVLMVGYTALGLWVLSQAFAVG